MVEAANGRVTFHANQILRTLGAMIVADRYLNAGGVGVSISNG
ncbi:hypothetical protein [Mesorhizobium amorphae]